MNRVLITGATGFIGNHLKARLLQKNYHVTCTTRQNSREQASVFSVDINDCKASWLPCLSGIDTVVHLAARVHILNETSDEPLAEFRRVNRDGAINLAKQCIQSGVKRFIFLSTIGVNGEETDTESFSETDPVYPVTDYAVSKAEAESGLLDVTRENPMELVIIRPPLVYGPDAPGNFSRLLKLVNNRVPLPLSRIKNRRSLLSVENLVDFIVTCIEHPNAANQLFLMADNETVSIADIVRHLSAGMGHKTVLFPLPEMVLRYGFKLMRKSRLYTQLCRSLEVDNSKAKTLLDWTPNITTEDSLRNTGMEYLNNFVIKTSM